MKRNVIVSSTRIAGSQPFRMESEATTWGELKRSILAQKGINCDDLKVIIQETEAELKSDDDTLPTTDFTIILFPVKAKAGK